MSLLYKKEVVSNYVLKSALESCFDETFLQVLKCKRYKGIRLSR